VHTLGSPQALVLLAQVKYLPLVPTQASSSEGAYPEERGRADGGEVMARVAPVLLGPMALSPRQ